MNVATRRSILPILAAVLGVLAFAGVARAAAPEEPRTESASGVTASAATFHGVLNPGKAGGPGIYELGTYEFLYRQSASECEGGSVAPESPGMSLGGGEEAVSGTVGGLLPNRQYTFCVLARNEAGETTLGRPVTFKTELTPPVLGEAWVTDVASSSATFNAQINPEGAETTYRFEYGTSESYGASVPLAVAGSGTGAVTVSAHTQSLEPHTVYHFRVVAVNAEGTAEGADQTFTTQTTSGELELLDGRQWELVSPPDKHGADLEPMREGGGVIQAAGDGSAIAYVATGPVTTEPEGNRTPEMDEVFSRRGAGGWETQDIASPHDAAKEYALGRGSEYRVFSIDLSRGLLVPRGETPLSPEATERTPYLRETGTGRYVPLVTAANTPPGTEFGGPPRDITGDVEAVGASPDFRHIVLASGVPLTSTSGDDGGLYEWAEGHLQLVSVLPDGEPVSGGLGFGFSRHAVSEDGSRVFWTDGDLYMRDMAKGETVQLDAVQGGSGGGGGTFQVASDDGSKVFFTASRLTANSSAGGDLYECEIVEVAGKLACSLSDLSVPENVGEEAGVETVIGASEDGSYVYFIARHVIAPGGESGAPNIYVHHGTTTKFVATLSSEDVRGGGSGLEQLTMRASPNGRFLAFMSERSLTGYDNRDANSGAPDEEVYLYDAEADGGRGRLVCASCNPTGARPVGVFDPASEFPSLLVDQQKIWEGRWLAGSVPGWTPVELAGALYQSRYLSDEGRLFFDSPDALVPQDTNGVEDVYEYEPAGTGSCTVTSATFSERLAGCAGLVSSGSSGVESAFMEASESGDDVFFLTAAPLVSQDRDTAYDIYDAHMCSAAVPCAATAVSPPACTTADSCRAAPSPQPAVFGAPASATFAGAGNLAPAASTPVVKAKPPKAKVKRRVKKHKGRKTGRGRRSGKGNVKPKGKR
jgi:hypothetical protein